MRIVTDVKKDHSTIFFFKLADANYNEIGYDSIDGELLAV